MQKRCKQGAGKHCKHESILDRWRNDDLYRAGQAEEHGWIIERVKYLQFVTSVGISNTAPNFLNTSLREYGALIFLTFPRAKEHGETTNLILQSKHNLSGYAKIGTPVSQHRHHPHLPRHGRKPRHGGMSQRWEDHQQWREWRPEEWQDPRWERE